jgi:predicted transcriptional regulator
VNILTVPQFALLKYAWRHGSFTVAEIHASGECGDVTPETIRSTVKRVCDKDVMVEIKEKGEPPRYGAKVSKQDYYICLAKTLFAGSTEDEKAFFKWAMDQV